MADEIVASYRHGDTDDAGTVLAKLTGSTPATVQLPSLCTWWVLVIEPDAGATGTVAVKPVPLGASAALTPSPANNTATLGTDAGVESAGRHSFDRVVLTPALAGADCGFTLTVGR